MNPILLKDFIQAARASLEPRYGTSEAGSLVSILCREIAHVEKYTHIIEPQYELSPKCLETLFSSLARIADGEPIQYVLGYEDFCGYRFKVTPSVLIPRPETQQLCCLALDILAGMPSGAKVLDLCTGSGCIAWTVAAGMDRAEKVTGKGNGNCENFCGTKVSVNCDEKSKVVTGKGDDCVEGDICKKVHNVPGNRDGIGVEVVGVDISEEALVIARSQNVPCIQSPRFVQADILSPDFELPSAPFDLLLSNPPYVLNREKALMRANVLEHEPSIALFVPDDDPLLFYRAIASASKRFLKPHGCGILEINEAFGSSVAELFSSAGYHDVSVIRDFRDKDRFVVFR